MPKFIPQTFDVSMQWRNSQGRGRGRVPPDDTSHQEISAEKVYQNGNFLMGKKHIICQEKKNKKNDFAPLKTILLTPLSVCVQVSKIGSAIPQTKQVSAENSL